MKDNFFSFKKINKIVHLILAIIFIFLFIFSFQASILYPIYSDEFEWKLISSRFFADQNKSLYLFPVCINSFFIDTPYSLYLGRILDSLIYQGAHSIGLLRNLGIIQYFISILLFWQIFTIQLNLRPIKSLLFILAFFSIGVLPMLMVMNRPEQPLLIYICLCVYISVLQTHKPSNILSNKIFTTFIFCILSNLIISTHPKGIYLIPIVIIAYRQIVKSYAFLIILLGTTLWTILQTIKFWSLRTSCSQSPWIEDLVKSFNLNLSISFSDPGQFFLQIIKNSIRFYVYIEQILFNTKYQSQWLPSIQISSLGQYLLWLINSLYLLIIISIFGFIVLRFFKININKINSCKQIAIAIAFSIITYTVMQVAKNFYESALIFPLLFLLIIFLVNPTDLISQKFLINLALPMLLVVGSISSVTRHVLFVDSFPVWRSSSSKLVKDKLELENFALNQCGIDTLDSGLIVDRQTYPIFWKHTRPIFLSGLTGWYGTGTDYRETLSHIDSDGVIAMCAGLPTALRDIAREDSGVCCVAKSNLQLLVK